MLEPATAPPPSLPAATTATALTGLLPEELVAALVQVGEKPYRAKQIQEWVFTKRATSYAEMTNLPATLRASLAASHPFHSLRVAQIQGAKDTTRKFLFRLHDGRYVESVLIPANKGFMGNQSDQIGRAHV